VFLNKTSSYRLIIDLREHNKSCVKESFKYEGIDSVLESVRQDDYMITIDIKYRFYHIPVHCDYQKYLGFCWKGRFFVFKVLPFGHCLSPYVFHKVCKPIVTYLRCQNVPCVLYVDDLLVTGDLECIDTHKSRTLSLLKDLGFIVNRDKCSLQPEQSKQYIGYVISTHNEDHKVWIRIPGSRIRAVKKDIRRILRKGSCTARMLVRVAGQCIAMSKAILPAKLLLRNLYRLLQSRCSWQHVLLLDRHTVSDLNWWLCALDTWNGMAVQTRTIDTQLVTDASSFAWGAVCQGMEAQGSWNNRPITGK
jgi:hypothetical protein